MYLHVVRKCVCIRVCNNNEIMKIHFISLLIFCVEYNQLLLIVIVRYLALTHLEFFKMNSDLISQ